LILGAISLLLLGSLLQAWYACNAKAPRSRQAIGFVMFGFYVIVVSVILLIIGLLLLWVAIGFFGAAIAALVFILVLPFIFVPLLTALNLNPPRHKSESAAAVERNQLNASWSERIRALEERTMPKADDFKREIHRIMSEAQNAGKESVVINAGELHRRVGGYPGTNHRMPNCCQVLRAQMLDSADMVVEAPPSGLGATLTIRYRLPRHNWD